MERRLQAPESRQGDEAQEGSGGPKREEQQDEQQTRREEQQGDQGKQDKQDQQDKQGQQGQQDEQGGGKQQPSRAEWVVGIACAVVVLAAVGYLFHQALTGPALPPMIRVEVERVAPMRSGYLVEFRAVNEGTATAANVMVEGTLLRDSVVVERSTATLDFVPAGTERGGGLFFTRDPGRYRLEVRPTGYDRP